MTGDGSVAQESESRNVDAAFIEPISWGLPGTRSTPAEPIEQQGQLTEYQSAGMKSSFDTNTNANRANLLQGIRHYLMRMILCKTLNTSVTA